MRAQVAIIVVFSLVGLGAYGQETTGSLSGRVLIAGQPHLGEITVAVSGRHQLGTRTQRIGRDGYFHVRGLPPGDYTVHITGIGLRPVYVDSIPVAIGRITTIPAVLMQPHVQQLDAVRIAGAGIHLDPANTDIGATASARDYASIPTGRDYTSIIGVLPHAIDSYRGDPINVAGASGPENAYFIDGVNVTEPLTADRATSLPFNFVRAVELKTGGYQARYGKAGGGIVNAITYSGTNEFEISAFSFGTHSDLAAGPKAEPNLREAGSITYDVGARISGPIVLDRLWYSVAFNPRTTRVRREIDGLGFFTDERKAHIYAAKLTWRGTPRTTVEASMFGDPTTHDAVARIGGIPAEFRPIEPNPFLTRYRRGGSTASVRLHLTPADRALVEAAVARSSVRHDHGPALQTGKPLFIDHVEQTIEGGGGLGGSFFGSTGLARLSARLGATVQLVTQEVTAGAEVENVQATSVGGGDEIRRTDLAAYHRYTEFGEGSSKTWTKASVAYLQDSWRISRSVTLNAGVRWSRQSLIAFDGGTGQRFPHEWQPRFGFVWQPGRLRRHRVLGSFGRYYQQLPANMANLFHGRPGTALFRMYDRDPRLPGAVAIDSLALAGDPNQFRHRQHVKAEHFDEIALGYEALLGEAAKLTTRLLRRELQASFQWGLGPSGVVVGTPGRGNFDFLPRAEREYRALEVGYESVRQNGSYRLSYVLSRSRGNYTGFYTSDQIDFVILPGGNASFFAPHQAVNTRGPLPNDRTHFLKVVGWRALSSRLSSGAVFTWHTGAPLNELAPGPLVPAHRAFVVPRGSSGRLPSLWDLNTRFSYRWTLASAESRVVVDVLHVGNPQRVVYVDELRYLRNDDGVLREPNSGYGQPIRYQSPLLMRVGIEIGRRPHAVRGRARPEASVKRRDDRPPSPSA